MRMGERSTPALTPLILLVEDNQDLNDINRRALERAGYEVACATTLNAARAELELADPDVILLDILMPDGDGIEFCRAIRDTCHAHILFLTSRTQEEFLLKALALGGDDYIVKPYALAELLARVNAALRRRGIDRARGERVARGDLALDARAQRAYVKGDDALLKPREFALIWFLMRNEGVSFAPEALYEAVWGQAANGDVRTVAQHISRLRRKLRLAEGEYEIVMERRARYVFRKKAGAQ